MYYDHASKFLPFTKTRRAVLALAVLAIAALAAYSYNSRAQQLPQNPSVDELFGNKQFYEGKTIVLLYVRASQPHSGGISVSEALSGGNMVPVALPPNSPKIDSGDFLAVTGVSELETRSAFNASEVHVYENIWWRPLVSLFALVFALQLAWREKAWRNFRASAITP